MFLGTTAFGSVSAKLDASRQGACRGDEGTVWALSDVQKWLHEHVLNLWKMSWVVPMAGLHAIGSTYVGPTRRLTAQGHAALWGRE